MRFRPEQHLRRQSDIRTVREQGRRVDCRAFTLLWMHRPTPVTTSPANASRSTDASRTPEPQTIAGIRVCFVASTSAVGAAVQRNRAKRRLREVFRHQQSLVPAGCDLMLIARAAATRWPLAELEKKFTEACGQINPARLPQAK
jgi:ribonuclease P protein component